MNRILRLAQLLILLFSCFGAFNSSAQLTMKIDTIYNHKYMYDDAIMVFTLQNTSGETIYAQKKDLVSIFAISDTDTAYRNSKKYRGTQIWLSNFRKFEDVFRCIRSLPRGDTLDLMFLYDRYIIETNRSLKSSSKGGEAYFIIRPDSSIKITSILHFDIWFKPTISNLTKKEIDAAGFDFELNVKYYTSSSGIVRSINILAPSYLPLRKMFFRKIQGK